MSGTPAGWAVAALRDLIELNPKTDAPDDAEAGFSPMPMLGTRYRDSVGFESRAWGSIRKAYVHFRDGDVLLAKITPCFENGKSGLVRGMPNSIGAGSSEYFVCRPNNLVLEPRYLLALLKTEGFMKEGETRMTGSVGHKRVPKDYLLDTEVPLAPLAEQRRIAAKLDALLTRVDACGNRLDRVPAVLKRFRQAVLRSAVAGELSLEWRSQQGTAVPRWVEVKVREAGKVQLGRQRAPQFHSGPNMRPYLRVQNVFEARIDLSDVMEMDFSPEDFERFQLHPGDILLNEGQSPQFLGRPALYRGELPGACFTNSLIRFQAYEHVLPEFALIVFRHHMHSGRYAHEGKITTNLAHLGAGRFAEVEFPLPSLAEQAEVVRRVESLFALADTIEAKWQTARTQVERLTPTLLAKAFRGELVPQDPNDEPAAELLKRLAQSRADVPDKTRKPRQRQPA